MRACRDTKCLSANQHTDQSICVVKRARCFSRQPKSSPCRLRPPSSVHGGHHLMLAGCAADSLSSQRSLQLARAVQSEIVPVSISRRQPALLAQLRAQQPREPARSMVRSTIYRALHRRIGHHWMGLGVGTVPRGYEIKCRMVGVARSAGNDSAQGTQGVSPRLASECRGPARPHGQALPGQPVRLWSAAQNVIQVPITHGRDQGPCTLPPRKQDPSRRGLHSK